MVVDGSSLCIQKSVGFAIFIGGETDIGGTVSGHS